MQNAPAPKAVVEQVVQPYIATEGGALRALSAREMAAIRSRRSEMSNQLSSARDRRNEVAGQLKNAPPGTEQGLIDQVAVLDARLIQIEQDIAVSGRLLTTGVIQAGTAQLVPERGLNSPNPQSIAAGGFMFAVVMVAFAFSRFVWRRSRSAAPTRESAEQVARMDRLEQAVDAVAIEIERVGEAHRYQARILAEANLMPALPVGQRAAEPLRVQEAEPLRARFQGT